MKKMICHFKYKHLWLSLSVLIFIAWSCTPRTEDKKDISREKFTWNIYSAHSLKIEYPNTTSLKRIHKEKESGGAWFNINYPEWNATLYCTYLPISAETLMQAYEDSHKLIYSHAAKATFIDEMKINSDSSLSSGIIFDIGGQVATPMQFFTTDSLNYFLRGSLYYNQKVDIDSVKFITNFIREDIIHMLETIKWESLN